MTCLFPAAWCRPDRGDVCSATPTPQPPPLHSAPSENQRRLADTSRTPQHLDIQRLQTAKRAALRSVREPNHAGRRGNDKRVRDKFVMCRLKQFRKLLIFFGLLWAERGVKPARPCFPLSHASCISSDRRIDGFPAYYYYVFLSFLAEQNRYSN